MEGVNIKFNETTLSDSRVFTCRQTDKHVEANVRHFLTHYLPP